MTRRTRVLRMVATALATLLGIAIAAAVARADALRDGDRAFKAGQLEQALRSYTAAAAQGSAPGQAGVGRVWLRRGQHERAMAAFRQAQQMDPELAWAYFGQGEIHRRQGRCEAAVPLLERATSLDRKFPDAQLSLANCLVTVGQFERGMAILDQGTRAGKEWAPRFLVARGTAWTTRDSLRNAGIDFTRAREMAPQDPSVRRALGEFYIQRGTWALAIPELQAAVSLDPSDHEARFSLGQALFYAQRYDEALETYRHLVATAPDFAPAQLGLGDLLYRAGEADSRRYVDAKAPLAEYTRLEPEDPRGWSLLGRTYFRLAERDSALPPLLEAQRRGDTNKETYTMLGLAHAARQEWEPALEAFAKGDPSPREYLTIAQIYDVTGRPAQADSIYRRYLARDSVSAGAAFAYQQLGRLRFREKDYAGAETLLARAIALRPEDGEAAFYRGLSLQELGREDEALGELRRSAQLDSTRADRQFWLGVLADRQKRYDEAERSFQRCADLDSTGALGGKASRQIGYYRLLDQRWGSAIEYLSRATTLDPQDAQAWLWLGQGHQNVGDRETAVECYRRVLAIDPGNAVARTGLKVLAK